MKRLILLGASGSIGTQSIEVIRQHQDELQLVGVSVGKKIDYLISLLDEFKDIKYAYCIEENLDLQKKYPDIKFFSGELGLEKIAKVDDYDILENALLKFVSYSIKKWLVSSSA